MSLLFYGLAIACASLLLTTTVSAQFERGFGGASINVTIYAPDGELMSLPTHVIVWPEGSLAGIQQTVCDNGLTTFHSLPSGTFVVKVQAPGFKDASTVVSVFTDAQAHAVVTMEAAPDPATEPGAMGVVLAPKASKQLQQGLDAIRRHKFDQAQRHLEAAYQLAPGNPDVNSAMGELYLAQQKLPEAEHYIDRATSLGPDNLDALLGAGELHIMERNPAAAEAPLEHATEIAPRNKFAHWLLGITYFNLGLYEKCRTEALAVIKINKSSATDGAFLLGESLAALGRTAEAVATLKEFVHKVPHDAYTVQAKKLIENLQTQAGSAPNAENPPSETASK